MSEAIPRLTARFRFTTTAFVVAILWTVPMNPTAMTPTSTPFGMTVTFALLMPEQKAAEGKVSAAAAVTVAAPEHTDAPEPAAAVESGDTLEPAAAGILAAVESGEQDSTAVSVTAAA